jgi:hypothetical protein
LILGKLIVIITFLMLTGMACQNAAFKDNDRILARVYDVYLYQSELENLMPADASSADSISITQNFINNWVKNQLILYKAEKNLTSAQKDFSKLIQDYRNSLVIYEYETQLITQKLDTVVRDWEIEKYYNENQNNFRLNDNIVKALYVKIGEKSKYLNRIKKFARSDREEDRDSLEFYCIRYAEDYGMIDYEWITFDDLLLRVPLPVGNPETFLTKNTFVQHYDKPYWYFVNFLDHRLSESLSPLSLERENIRSVLLNKRKKLLIKKMQDEIYEQALKENNFEYF